MLGSLLLEAPLPSKSQQALRCIAVRRHLADLGQFFVSVDSLKFVPSQSKNERQWPFQEPKLEVPTIYNVYIRPM